MNDLAVATSLATSPFSAFAELRERVWSTLLSEAREAEFQIGRA